MRGRTIIDLLSKRDQIVLQWLIEGLRDKDIAPLLGLTTRSAGRIVREICDKLNARTRTQAACMFLVGHIPHSLPLAGLALHPRSTSRSSPQESPAEAGWSLISVN